MANNSSNAGIFKFKCLEVTQPIGTFYIAIMPYRDLKKITYSDIRKISQNDIEKYLGIQRKLSKKRLIEIDDYVHTRDATFPTSIVIAIDSEHIEYIRDTGELLISNEEDVALIIDGQHRLEGLRNYSEDRFELIVTVFVDMDLEDKSMVFATINLAQTKVSKSLVYDLYENTKLRSPIKSAHELSRALNASQKSPFSGRIKTLGTAERKNQTLTQATVVEALIPMISGTIQLALKDRDLIKREKPLKRADNDDSQKIFRNYFIDGEDIVIAENIINYFSAVAKIWEIAWAAVTETGNMLPRTNGFKAFMKALPKIYRILGNEQKKDVYTIEEFKSLLKNITLEDKDFNTTNYLPGQMGEDKLYKMIIKDVIK